MDRRLLLAAVAMSTFASALFAGACSSTTPTPFDEPSAEAGPDGTVVPDAAPVTRDASDGGVVSPQPEAGPSQEAGPEAGGGHCTPLQGPACDLVLQDCPRAAGGGAQECTAAQSADGGITTACVPVSGAKSIQKGYPCCLSAGGSVDPCLAGLQCIGGESCPDGGAPTGKCTPYCCEGDNSVCGSDNNGIQGRCTLTIVGPDAPHPPLYNVCTYSPVCRPLGVQPCQQGYTCLVTDNSGTARCSQIYSADGGPGLAHQQPCGAANACAPGMQCLGTADGGSFCEYLCHVQGTVTPFDAGALTNAPGKGGCPSSTPTCRAVPNLFPSWLGICD